MGSHWVETLVKVAILIAYQPLSVDTINGLWIGHAVLFRVCNVGQKAFKVLSVN